MTEYYLLGVGLLMVPLFTLMTIEILTNDLVDNLHVLIISIPFVMSIGALYFGVDNLLYGKLEKYPKDVRELMKRK